MSSKRFIPYFSFISQSYRQLLGLLFPHHCVLCSVKTLRPAGLCEPCQKDLPILAHNCEKCGQFLPSLQKICGSCLNDNPPFDSTIALFAYQEPLIQLIIGLKFRQKIYIANTLGQLFLERLQHKAPILPDLILPIPLHVKRLQKRGFNQAIEIARPIAKGLNLTLDVTGARRSKETIAQSSLSSSLRKENVKHAFQIRRNYTGLHLAVIDDVMTTGHTMRAFCQALKEKGAKTISVWCIARCDIAINPKTR